MWHCIINAIQYKQFKSQGSAPKVLRWELMQNWLLNSTACGHRMADRKWKEGKQQPSMLLGSAVPGISLVSFYFLWAILKFVSKVRALLSAQRQQCHANSARTFDTLFMSAGCRASSKWSEYSLIGWHYQWTEIRSFRCWGPDIHPTGPTGFKPWFGAGKNDCRQMFRGEKYLQYHAK